MNKNANLSLTMKPNNNLLMDMWAYGKKNKYKLILESLFPQSRSQGISVWRRCMCTYDQTIHGGPKSPQTKVVKELIVLYQILVQNTTKDEQTTRSTTRKIDLQQLFQLMFLSTFREKYG